MVTATLVAKTSQGEYLKRLYPFTLVFLSFCIMLAEEAKTCFSPWSTCWLHSSLEFEKSLKRYVRLAESIGRYGYQSRNELKDIHGNNMKRRWWLEAGEQEVGVAIGPAGEVWRFGGGYHRTAIARNLGLEEMPVMIRLVHEKWLRKQKYQLDSLLPSIKC